MTVFLHLKDISYLHKRSWLRSPLISCFIDLIFRKYIYCAVKDVDDFCSIWKAIIFSAEQLILGIEASRFVESLRLKDKLFPFLKSSNWILTRRN